MIFSLFAFIHYLDNFINLFPLFIGLGWVNKVRVVSGNVNIPVSVMSSDLRNSGDDIYKTLKPGPATGL